MISTENLKNVVTKHFGDGASKMLELVGWEKYKSPNNPVYVDVKSGDSGSVQIILGVKSVGSVMNFTLAPYPACCGIRMFHSFRAHESLPQEFVDDFMNTFVAEAGQIYLGVSKRIEVIMVEYGSYGHMNNKDQKEYFKATRECPVTENPNIQYKTLWNYFHKHAKQVRTRLQMNTNSGNILHNMEVIFG